MTTNPFIEDREFKPYSVEQRRVKDQSLQDLSGHVSIPFDTAGDPRAKTVRTSVNNIQPVHHRKRGVIYHQTPPQPPIGREASQLQQVIHLNYHFLVTIKPTGFKIRKNTPRAISSL